MNRSNLKALGRKALGTVAAVVLLLGAVHSARAEVVYSNDFEDTVGTTYAEWSSTGQPADADVTPSGRGFLGRFGNGTTSLSLAGLPAHDEIEVEFDLFIIYSWDGSSSIYGPDVWSFGVGGGDTLLTATFSNTIDLGDSHEQTYPNSYPGATNPRETGAAEVNVLGYAMGPQTDSDSIYRIKLKFPHDSDSIVLNAIATGLMPLDDESWGLDNFTVSAVPEPGSLALLGWGLLGLAVLVRRKKRAS